MKRIAISHKDGEIFPYFGKTTEFKIYDIDGTTIVNANVIDTNGAKHGEIITFLQTQNVDTVILNAMCQGACSKLQNANIHYISGASGNCDDIIHQYLTNSLQTDENIIESCHA